IDSMVYVLPLHFERMADSSILNKPQFTHIFEIYRQAVIELRLVVRYLKELGYQKVGCLGFSFGGYCCSLLACFENNTDFIIPMASLGDLGPILRYLEKGLKLEEQNGQTYATRMNRYLAKNHLSLISPISFKPLIAKENILFIQGLMDGRTPFAGVQKFRKVWDYPRVVWYPCDHFTFIFFNRLTARIASNFIARL
ncbi:MAG: alpha/beta hydrolase family protein, partial [Actinomycetota bacterium]